MGIQGQDDLLDTFHLQEGDRQVVEEKAFGECHQACFLSSNWGSFWYARRLRTFVTIRLYKILHDFESFTLLQDARNTTILILYKLGALHGFSFIQFEDRVPTDFGALVPVEQEQNIDLSEIPGLAERCRQEFVSKGSLSWDGLLDEFGIRGRLLFPAAIQNSSLLPIKGLTTDNLKKNYLTVNAKYSIYIPKTIEFITNVLVSGTEPPTD